MRERERDIINHDLTTSLPISIFCYLNMQAKVKKERKKRKNVQIFFREIVIFCNFGAIALVHTGVYNLR